MTRSFQRALKTAGLPHQRFHDLRHSAATFLLAQGFTLEDVKNLLGHSSIVLTSNTYRHVLGSGSVRWRWGWTRCWAGEDPTQVLFRTSDAVSAAGTVQRLGAS